MELLNKVKTELEKTKQYDFASDLWTGEMLVILYDTIYATEKVIDQNNLTEILHTIAAHYSWSQNKEFDNGYNAAIKDVLQLFVLETNTLRNKAK